MGIKAMAACTTVVLALVACGKSSTEEPVQPAPVVEVKAGDQVIKLSAGGAWATPITHNFVKPGRYKLTMTGQLQVDGPGEALVSLDPSGAGLFSSGTAHRNYTITAAGGQMIPIDQTATLDVAEPGPWQVRVHIQTYSVGGTLSNIQLKIVS